MRYNALLEGLEIVELTLHEVLKENFTYRFDSEYFKKEYLDTIETISEIEYSSVEQIGNVKGGKRLPLNEDFSPEGIPYIRAEDVRLFVNYENSPKVSIELFNKLSNYQTKKDDVLITIVGNSIGDVGIVKFDLDKCNLTENCVKVVNLSSITPDYFFAFLNSSYGQRQIEREKVGTAQPKLSIERIRKIRVPIFSRSFQIDISRIVNESYGLLQKSNIIYTQASELLEETLGLKNWQPSEENINVRRFSNSFATTGRLDAEYYQPMYEELEKKLSKFKMYAVKDIISYPVSSGSTPKAGGDDYTDKQNGVPFIRAVDLNNSIVMTDNFIYVKKGIHNGLLKRTQIKKNDVLFSIAGTVGRTAVFSHDFDANINQAVAILRFDESVFKRFYVTTFFNSRIGKVYIEKYSRQGLQTNLNLEEVAGLKIPCIDYNKQNEIASFIEYAIELKQQSSQLLEEAKQAVEIAIEQGEEAAMKFLK